MNVSGILVIVPPDQVDAYCGQLDGVDGVDVHHTDPPSGRIVATIEGEDTDAEIATLRQVKAIPGVLLAEMVYHYVGEEATPDYAVSEPVPAKLRASQGEG